MLKNIHIKKFKCLEDENLEFGELTILAGKNSSGKSTVIQSILLAARNCNPQNKERMYNAISKYLDLPFDFELADETNTYACSNDKSGKMPDDVLSYENSLYYLSSNRFGQEDLPKFSREYKVGDNGEFLIGTYLSKITDNVNFELKDNDCEYLFEISKNENVFKENIENLIDIINTIDEKSKMTIPTDFCSIKKFITNKKIRNDCPDNIKKAMYNAIDIPIIINCWLSYITESKNSFLAKLVTSDRCKAFFQQTGIGEINPFNVGTGMSFLVKVLILCFLAKPGDVVIIENPEIHLHPKAQSRLGEFFSFLASKKIQLIIETHCEHLINSLRYQVYKKKISKDDIVIHYKEDENTHFQKIRISDDGYYINTDGKKIPFPNGFFDVSVQQLMEIGL